LGYVKKKKKKKEQLIVEPGPLPGPEQLPFETFSVAFWIFKPSSEKLAIDRRYPPDNRPPNKANRIDIGGPTCLFFPPRAIVVMAWVA